MSLEFRELLKKVGSGPHTSKDLTQAEASLAMELMLKQEATPAQIGAFLIAHRIKRPTAAELAGLWDGYDRYGPVLSPLETEQPIITFGHPYDGRDRTCPVSVVTALMLAQAGAKVILHGSSVTPSKNGMTLMAILGGLGLEFANHSLTALGEMLIQKNLTFVYIPDHFPLAHQLLPYREQIGKRPPLSTLELMWSPYHPPHHQIMGYVHPPTEKMIVGAMVLRHKNQFTLVKGLEGSCDLPTSRTAIIGIGNPAMEEGIERLKLAPRDYDLGGPDVPFTSEGFVLDQLRALLQGQSCDLTRAAIWNGGFYLWRCGLCDDLDSGIMRAQEILNQGQLAPWLT